MIDIDKEGYVAVASNQIPLRNYLFYLTYNNRATSVNKMRGVDLTSRDIYKASREYAEKRYSEGAVVGNKDKGEIVMSFSPRLCHLVVKNKYLNNVKSFKQDFEKTVEGIISEHLEQKEFSLFVHEYDSKQMRVHAHVLFYPYLEPSMTIDSPSGGLVLREPKLWVEPERLEKIKRDFNQYARRLYSGLEVKDKTLSKAFEPKRPEREDLFDVIKTLHTRTPEFDKSDLKSKWSEKEIERLQERIEDLKRMKETGDNIINTKDFTIVVDYLYDFEDKEVYELFFDNPLILNVIRSFSVFKSNPKFSLSFLKVLELTKKPDIVDLIESKTRSSKGQELFNILNESLTKDDGRMSNIKYQTVRTYDRG